MCLKEFWKTGRRFYRLSAAQAMLPGLRLRPDSAGLRSAIVFRVYPPLCSLFKSEGLARLAASSVLPEYSKIWRWTSSIAPSEFAVDTKPERHRKCERAQKSLSLYDVCFRLEK
jgi:hypothetical protein